MLTTILSLTLCLAPQLQSRLPEPATQLGSHWQLAPFAHADGSRFAAHIETPQGEVSLRKRLREKSVAVLNEEAFGLEGYRVFELATALSESRLEELVEDVASLPGIGFVSPVYRDERGELTYPTPYLYVKFRAELSRPEASRLIGRLPSLVVNEPDLAGLLGAYRLESAAATGMAVLEELEVLQRLPGVEYAGSDRVMTMVSHVVTPNDQHFPNQWGIRNTGQTINGIVGVPDTDIDADEVWEQTTGDPSILIVVLDVGVQQNHPDINQVGGQDFTDEAPGNGGPRNVCDRHGTAMAGVITGIMNNSIGVAGVAPTCRVASARIGKSSLACNGSATVLPSWVANAVNWSVTIGARVTNMSNSVGFDTLIDNAYSSARASGVIHFAATGNTGPVNGIEYPASSTAVHAVGAIVVDGSVRANSNRACSQFGGDCIDFVAPGDGIWTTDDTTNGYDSNEDYVSVNGTSPACAFASGIAALMLSIDPALTPQELYSLMYFGCSHPFDYDDYSNPGQGDVGDGGGLLNAASTAWAIGDVYVDYQAGPGGNGSLFSPFQTIAQGVVAASADDVISVWFGSYPENLTITKAVEIRPHPVAGGDLVIGQ